MARLDRRAFALIAATLLCGFLTAPSTSSAGPGYVNFMFGQKVFDSDDWDPISKQPSFGVEAAFGPATWPVRIDTYVFRASKEKTEYAPGGVGGSIPYQVEGTTFETGVGANKTWTKGKLYPYIGAGGVYAKVDVTWKQSGLSSSTDANGFGFWGGGGIFYRIGTRFNLGGTVRYSSATVDFSAYNAGNVSFGGADIAAGGTTFGALLGWGWPATP